MSTAMRECLESDIHYRPRFRLGGSSVRLTLTTRSHPCVGGATVAERICVIESCQKLGEKRGWCAMHYRRWWRHGDPIYVRPPRTHKTCVACGVTKPLDEFYRKVKARSYTPRCRPCHLELCKSERLGRRDADLARKRAYYQRNRDYFAALGKARYWSDPESARKAKRQDYQKNRVKRRAYLEQWKRDNRERFAAMQRANAYVRRAMKLSSAQVVTAAQIQARVAFWKYACWVCQGSWSQIDHVKPLSKGGSHIAANLRPICGDCNKRKSARWPYGRLDALGELV